MQRTFIGEINKKEHLNKTISVSGWVKKIRLLGKLNFIELRDITGLIQIVIDQQEINLTRESVITVVGKLVKRKSVNKNIVNGDLEIINPKITVHSIAEIPPLIIEEQTDALEEVRFENRFLDLRRPNIQKIFLFRSLLIQKINQFLSTKGFNYIETPILAKPTPEGARDYLVPSRIKHSTFYALPQSPQIYKQLLMVSGFERYYQIAKCFRDEDLRSDRQPEFTQLDMELSFVEEDDIYKLVEQMMKFLLKETLNINIKTPFIKMDYDDCMLNYGNDKPDLRFENKILDSTEIIKQSQNELIKSFFDSNLVCRTLVFQNLDISRKTIDELNVFLESSSYRKLSYIKIENNEYSGNFNSKLEQQYVDEILKKHDIHTKNKLIIFFNFDEYKQASVQLGVIRNWVAKHFNLTDEKDFKFLWVINWPLYEYDSETQKYSAAHHPFTQPQKQCHQTFDTNQENAKARAYDLVLNGVELGGGSIRITDKQMQERMFKSIGLNEQEYMSKFSTLLNAFKYGVPPHAGIAFGLDRFIQLLLGLDNIKECISFPKNTKAYDPTIDTPSSVDESTLTELGLKLK